MSTIANTPLLRRLLGIDAVLGVATAACLLAAAQPLAAATGLPAAVLQGLGLALLPWAAWLAWLARSATLARAAVGTVVVVNFVWALDAALLAFGAFGTPPQALGTAFLVAQAAGAFVLAELEWLGLKRAPAAPALRGVFAG